MVKLKMSLKKIELDINVAKKTGNSAGFLRQAANYAANSEFRSVA